MPANIAHLLICNKSVKALEDGGDYEEFIRILDSDECKPYLNLGSIGPDLSYYGRVVDLLIWNIHVGFGVLFPFISCEV